MADKYLIHGATYCGDGTASNEAASAGAAGAWNDIAIFSNSSNSTATAPAYGTLSAGDIIHIRSKTAAGADIEISSNTAAQYLGSQVGTVSAPVKWVLDAGTIWSGISGTLKLTHSAANNNYGWTVRGHNWLMADAVDGIAVTETRTDHYATVFALSFNGGENHFKNILIDASGVTNSTGSTLLYLAGGSTGARAIFINLNIKAYSGGVVIDPASTGSRYTFVNLQIEMLTASKTWAYLAKLSSGIGKLTFIGGRVYGAGYSTNVSSFFSGSMPFGGDVQMYGFQLPTTVPIMADSLNHGALSADSISGVGVDSGLGGYQREYWGRIDSRNDGYYPTLNATLPNSATTKWSWQVYPKNVTNDAMAEIVFSKLYTSAAAQKKVTLEFLLSNSFTTLHSGNCWLDVVYIDSSTGVPKHVGTFDIAGNALSSSSSVWTAAGTESTPTWGAIAFSRKKFEVTTPTSIKQDTMVIAMLHLLQGSGSANDILFVCPDLQLSTP